MNLPRGRALAVIVYLTVAGLVTGGLAWVTRAALTLEQSDTIRLALWRLDSRVFPAVAREDGRPVAHYEPLFPPVPALDRRGKPVAAGAVLIPSPLLSAELPEWMALHFVVDAKLGWRSPQVLDPELTARLTAEPAALVLTNATAGRRERLAELASAFAVNEFLGVPAQSTPAAPQWAQRQDDSAQRGAPPQVAGPLLEAEYQKRAATQMAVRGEGKDANAANSNIINIPQTDTAYFRDPAWSKMVQCVSASVEELAPQWRRGGDGADRLLLLRTVRTDGLTFSQGVLIDWPKLRETLLAEVRDILPEATLEPAVAGQGGELMTALPVRLSAGPAGAGIGPLNTPMRWGLALAWSAAALALVVVGLSGWSLLDLSERRFRFVTAVTHELRTPLTTLRLYLDMLTSGLVKREQQRDEYLQTLHHESDRLHRLISNVLDYARLERQRPVVRRETTALPSLLESIRHDWDGRCKAAGKQLLIDCHSEAAITTDADLCRQLLGNLIDNACKYAHGTGDARVWVRAFADGPAVVFEVEDKGPGVAAGEHRSVFRAFRRGRAAATTGGVGLGLALASRWAGLLGGTLRLKPGHTGGACFQFTHPGG
jgi:signal transduction histidine kinase